MGELSLGFLRQKRLVNSNEVLVYHRSVGVLCHYYICFGVREMPAGEPSHSVLFYSSDGVVSFDACMRTGSSVLVFIRYLTVKEGKEFIPA